MAGTAPPAPLLRAARRRMALPPGPRPGLALDGTTTAGRAWQPSQPGTTMPGTKTQGRKTLGIRPLTQRPFRWPMVQRRAAGPAEAAALP